MVVDDRFYMQLCLNEAWKYQGLTYPNPAVGALILNRDGKILAIDAHKSSGNSHAELNVILKALNLDIDNPINAYQHLIKNYTNYFKESTIYITLEPCNHHGKTPPCSNLIKNLGFSRVVVGSKESNKVASGGVESLKNSKVDLKIGVLKDRCDELLIPFKKWQKSKSYIFFKLAISKNGVYTGGIITSQRSRELVHKLREKIDLLVIGGNSVRVDRPILDTRLVEGKKAPDILIYSKRDDFDRTIPLFSVDNRKVFIEDTLDRVKDYRFVMIEGGEEMLKATYPTIDSILIFTSPNFKIGSNIQLDLKLRSLHIREDGADTIQWFSKL